MIIKDNEINLERTNLRIYNFIGILILIISLFFIIMGIIFEHFLRFIGLLLVPFAGASFGKGILSKYRSSWIKKDIKLFLT